MKSASSAKTLSADEQSDLLKTLKARFEKNAARHKGCEWAKVEAKLKAQPAKLRSLSEMEKTGGEPDVIGYDKKADEYTFADCSPQSPEARGSFCYDREALDSRKEHKPKNNVVDAAAALGAELLNEDEYQALQKLGEFDTKSSSWLKTPDAIRKLGGAIFGDRRFGRVFIYHNGAESYYRGRGFRTSLKI